MILDAFAGPGGWDVGARSLGLDPVGIEWDPDACSTRAAAGLRTIRADVAAMPLAHLRGRVEGVILSPPCQDWSRAGKGRRQDGDSGHLVAEVLRWADEIEPVWLAAEQVDTVAPLWAEYAYRLRERGYSAWSGVLDSADYGVPQNRRRAILMAHRHKPAQPPAPTHAEHPHPTLDGIELRPWVSMADALGWGNTGGVRSQQLRTGTHNREISGGKRTSRVRTVEEPAPTLAFGHAFAEWAWVRPSTTICDASRVTQPGHHEHQWDNAVPITMEEALVLQGFPPDYPICGRTKHARSTQVGNAVPPPLAAAILGQVIL